MEIKILTVAPVGRPQTTGHFVVTIPYRPRGKNNR